MTPQKKLYIKSSLFAALLTAFGIAAIVSLQLWPSVFLQDWKDKKDLASIVTAIIFLFPLTITALFTCYKASKYNQKDRDELSEQLIEQSNRGNISAMNNLLEQGADINF